MGWIRGAFMGRSIMRRLRVLLDRERFDRELEEEMREHLLHKAAETGDMNAARRAFGNVTALMEESRGLWLWPLAWQVLQDVRYAFRAMGGNKLFTATAIFSLALGIGATTAIYSFLDAVLLRTLPVRNPEQLVILNWRARQNPAVVRSHSGENYAEPGAGITCPNFPYPAFESLRDNNQVLSSLFGHTRSGRLNIVTDGQAEVAHGQYVTGGLFDGLGVPAAAGRVISREDDRASSAPVAMLAFDYWKGRFGGDLAVVGKPIQVNGTPFTIIGVAAPGFFGVSPAVKPKIFLPVARIGLPDSGSNFKTFFADGNFYWIELMGRLKPGVTMAAAQARLAGPFRNFVESTASEKERADLPSLWLQDGASGVDGLRRTHSTSIWILMTMVVLILAIACANVANLLLARAAARRREMAVRLSIGASRFRVIRQLLTESVMLALAGSAAGILVASLGIRMLLALLAAGDDTFTVEVGIDWRVLWFTITVAVATGVLFGLLPALQTTRVDLTVALKETRAKNAGRKHRRWAFSAGQSLVVVQIAFSLLLVVAAGLFVRTLANLHAVQLGFNADGVLIFNLNASKAGYRGAALAGFYDGVQRRLRALPGVRSVTTSDLPLVGGWSSRATVTVPGVVDAQRGQAGVPLTSLARVGEGFFETMEIPILAGRPIDQRDNEDAPKVAVVNQVFASKYFAGADPVGRHFKLGGGNNPLGVEIVGLARTARYNSLKGEIPAVAYLPWRQAVRGNPVRTLHFEVRTAGNDPLQLAESVRGAVKEVSPMVPIEDLTSQKRRIDQTIRQERTFARLCTSFGALALLIACVGLYGTMAFSVSRRTGELGIRMALGAGRGRIVCLVLREVAILAGCGMAMGMVAAYQVSPALESFLFGLKPVDPLALGFSASILLASILIAGFLPAYRASRIDPLDALRHD